MSIREPYVYFRRGFTVIELLVVIVVIAILAALSYVGYNSLSDRGRAAATTSDLKSIDNATQIFFAKNKRFPSSLGEVSASGIPSGSNSKIKWIFASYYGSYSKQGDGVVKGQYRIFSVAEDLYVLYYDYEAETWQMHRQRLTGSGGFDVVENLNCKANLLDDCFSS